MRAFAICPVLALGSGGAPVATAPSWVVRGEWNSEKEAAEAIHRSDSIRGKLFGEKNATICFGDEILVEGARRYRLSNVVIEDL